MTRLIDADALKEKIEIDNFDSPMMNPVMTMTKVLEYIDEAPTAEINVVAIRAEADQKGYKRGYHFGLKIGRELTQPRGEWIDESKDALKCSACGKWVYKPFIGGFPTERTQHYAPNYCAFCGASMVKEGE